MSSIQKQAAPFFKSWKSYGLKIRSTLNKCRVPCLKSKGRPQGLSSEKWSCLDAVDKHFNSAIEPIIKSFAKRNLLIREGIGKNKDKKIFHKFAEYIVRLCGSHLDNKPVSPRVEIYDPIETDEDVWKTIEDTPTYRIDSPSEAWNDVHEELKKQCSNYKQLFLELIKREMSIQAKSKEMGEKRNEYQEAKAPAHNWELNIKTYGVKCNGKGPIKLEPRLFKLFEYLHKRRNKKVTIKTLEKHLNKEGGYKYLAKNRLNKLISALNKEAKILGLKKGEIKHIIEKEKDGKKLKSVTLHTF